MGGYPVLFLFLDIFGLCGFLKLGRRLAVCGILAGIKFAVVLFGLQVSGVFEAFVEL